ncbi:alpha/beta hydrolase, partial [Streptomyces fulvissimus]|nr:alpha/beta hydrolase [Streptomyces microflavus]
LDWDDPDGDTLDLALVRARSSAKNEDQRIGSLIFNFGGPGGSGVSTLPAFGDTYETLRGRYDLVSFDPRGVGR